MPTVVRLSDETETSVNLAGPDAVGAPSGGGCLMVTGFEGTRSRSRRERRRRAELAGARRHRARRRTRGRLGAGRFDGPLPA